MGKTIPKFWGDAKDGKIMFYNEIKYFQYLNTLTGRVSIVVAPEEQSRTTKQNNYYWAYLNIIGNDTGDDPNYLHEIFKRRFLTPITVTVLGKEYTLPRSTTDLKKAEFGEYITRIEVETGIPAPNPNDFYH